MTEEPQAPDSAGTSLWRQAQGAAREEKTGFGGPLLLVAIGCVLGPIRAGWGLWQNAAVYIDPEVWNALTDPESEMYHRLWVPVFTYEIVGSTFFFVGSVVLAWLFFTKRRILPPALIAFLLFGAAFDWGDYWLTGMIPFVAESGEGPGMRDAIGSTISAAIWCPYFLISERVKNTFVR